ncbi:MAG: N-acetylmuramic acid 6-phosphate etherase, partial [Planctomycetota bacterium]
MAGGEGRRRDRARKLLLQRSARRLRPGPVRLLQEARDPPRGRGQAPSLAQAPREEEEVKRPFSSLSTEQRNPRTVGIDSLSIPEILDVLNREDEAIAVAVGAEKPKVARAVNLLVDRVGKGGRILFVGAGTSGRLGVLEAAELPPTFDTPPRLAQAIMAGGPECVWASKEGAEDDAADGARQLRIRAVHALDVVVGITASGVTPFVLGALGEARKKGAARILVSCNRRGVPRDAADVHIAPLVGP